MAADMELGLVWDDDRENFEVSLRLVAPGSDDRLDHVNDGVRIDEQALAAVGDDEPAYGVRLSRMLFAHDKVVEFYEKALIAAGGEPLHLRLHVHGPARFHNLRWESVRAPGADGPPIATMDNVLFSRYLSSEDWRPITLTTSPGHRALVVIAAPDDLAQYRLADVDAAGERARALAALQGYSVDVLCGGGEASLARIAEQLEKHHYEVLYLVAHGRWVDGEAHLVLEGPDGKYARVDGLRLAERVRGVERRPTLSILLSCQSAMGNVVLGGLGPRLSGAGIPAVIAMQGEVTMKTAQDFATAFFSAFREQPVVDRAVAVARRAVRDRPDWWAPVLFSRLRSGRAYQPSVTSVSDTVWEDIGAVMAMEEVTPVLGPGLADGIVGSRSEIAQRWVRRWQMPIAPFGRTNLAQVAQYLRVGRKPAVVRAYLRKYLLDDLLERVEIAKEGDAFHGLPENLLTCRNPLPIIHEIGRRTRAEDPDDPYRVVSALRSKVYFTTGWTNLLQDAMRERGKEPRTLCFPWSGDGKWLDLDDKDVQKWPLPTVDSPWVCHLFGRLDRPDSLVLTEDDYFAWLSAWIERRPTMSKLLPTLSLSLTNRSLLFVGYQLREWDFQVLYQSIQTFGGAQLRDDYPHVGVQLMPDVDVIEPEAAQRYLESSLSNVHIFWSDARTFLADLRDRTGLAV
ncbi:hypothetical protein Lesp02_38700 [Lentzea sp. NBRC 105346]|uniref:CHAT domain-containing protein n=1 Tax=Lentzea sp. NBRC 105346 TaxID=3032205 RepID=UPI0024A3A552|nr:CHAT domain-containing protein [Lentzea sp. NBRC 105346]GLZ31682.1 hypothetical protein Lesp02_38700 [Lentzea sp. NBRC 105346]